MYMFLERMAGFDEPSKERRSSKRASRAPEIEPVVEPPGPLVPAPRSTTGQPRASKSGNSIGNHFSGSSFHTLWAAWKACGHLTCILFSYHTRIHC